MATIPVPWGPTLLDFRHLTPARVGLGRAGASVPTDALLARVVVGDAIGVVLGVRMIHGSGLYHDEAASRIAWLIRAALARGMTGVALKDESRGHISGQVAVTGSSR